MKINLKGVYQYPNLGPSKQFQVPEYKNKLTKYTADACLKILPGQNDYVQCIRCFIPAFNCIINSRAEKFGEVNDNYQYCLEFIDKGIILLKSEYPNVTDKDMESAVNKFKAHCGELSKSEKPFI